MTARLESFSEGVHNQLKTYVYRLIDPRNGQTFYVGKGKGDRVFQHVKGALEVKDDDVLTEKVAMIREMIEVDRLEPIHVIHRHGLTEDEALAVEAALIDYIPGLANQVRGHGAEFGPTTAELLNELYTAEELVRQPDHKLMYIKIKTETVSGRGSVYEATRWSWVVDVNRANRVDYILSIVNGMCRGVFMNCVWSKSEDGRFEFVGEQLAKTHEISKYYINKRVPEMLMKKGAQNPIRYDVTHRNRDCRLVSFSTMSVEFIFLIRVFPNRERESESSLNRTFSRQRSLTRVRTPPLVPNE